MFKTKNKKIITDSKLEHSTGGSSTFKPGFRQQATRGQTLKGLNRTSEFGKTQNTTPGKKPQHLAATLSKTGRYNPSGRPRHPNVLLGVKVHLKPLSESRASEFPNSDRT